ncbi:MAG: ribosome assembly RNA-binding protein YhbY [Bacilli bacterium]
MLTGKQKRHLRALAHHENPIFQVGKGGVNDQLIQHVVDAIEKRELLKISILNTCDQPKEEVAKLISDGAHAELVQIIGKTVVVYKESKDHKTIELPR